MRFADAETRVSKSSETSVKPPGDDDLRGTAGNLCSVYLHYRLFLSLFLFPSLYLPPARYASLERTVGYPSICHNYIAVSFRLDDNDAR